MAFALAWAVIVDSSSAAAQRVDPHAFVTSDGPEIMRAARTALRGVQGFVGTARLVADRTAAAPVGLSPSAEAEALDDDGAHPETIIEPDDRVRVIPTTAYPARAVALVTFTQGFPRLTCTAWMIGPDTAVTAGHCVHSGGANGAFSTNVRVFPGRNAGSGPYGSCAARRLYTSVGWASLGDERYDYGAIKLACTIGNVTGWFGFFAQTATFTGVEQRINGYPSDKRLTQWRADDQIRLSQTSQLFYQTDTLGGMSGSPVYQPARAGRFCTGACAIAIHGYGLHGAPPHGTHNHGTRITQAVFENLLAWRSAP
jgi:glutamyl endopeptidase